MRAFIFAAAALALAVTLFAACKSRDAVGTNANGANTAAAAPQSTVEGDGVRRITPAEARAALDGGNAVIIDTRGEDAYKSEHIKGSISIPLAQIDARAGELPRNKMIITYCS